MVRPEAETLNSMHQELYGAPMLDCDVCMRKARNLLVNQYRWSPKESRGEYAIAMTKRINEALSDPAVQAAIHSELAPHYEDKS